MTGTQGSGPRWRHHGQAVGAGAWQLIHPAGGEPLPAHAVRRAGQMATTRHTRAAAVTRRDQAPATHPVLGDLSGDRAGQPWVEGASSRGFWVPEERSGVLNEAGASYRKATFLVFSFVLLREGFATESNMALNSLCSPSWPQSHGDRPASAFSVLDDRRVPLRPTERLLGVASPAPKEAGSPGSQPSFPAPGKQEVARI